VDLDGDSSTIVVNRDDVVFRVDIDLEAVHRRVIDLEIQQEPFKCK
jgi:hypothetical protein